MISSCHPTDLASHQAFKVTIYNANDSKLSKTLHILPCIGSRCRGALRKRPRRTKIRYSCNICEALYSADRPGRHKKSIQFKR